MSSEQLMARAAVPMIEIIRNINPEQLTAQTPCAQYDVRRLLNHLLFWGPSLEASARKEAVPPPAEAESAVDLTEDHWATSLHEHIGRTVASWDEPRAWEGVTYMGGPTEMPAALVGGMIVGELVVHAWDLAQATGQHVSWDGDLLEYLHDQVAKTADQGRQLGIYGPEVAVPAAAPTLDRILGLTGRDPDGNGG